MLKIEGTKMNHLRVYLEGLNIGELDNDHRIIRVSYTENEFKERFGEVNLAYEVANYYDEIEVTDEFEAIPTVDYRVDFEDESDED